MNEKVRELIEKVEASVKELMGEVETKAIDEPTGWHYTAYIAGSCSPRYDIKSRDGTIIGTVHIGANAQLMAAAPDLLEAAKEAFRLICLMYGTEPSDEGFLLLKKAIAKAEGREL